MSEFMELNDINDRDTQFQDDLLPKDERYLDEKLADHKFDVCENCRNNYPNKLGINQGVANLLCRFCNGVKSNYEPVRSDEWFKIDGGNDEK
jgi:hypothetical protein